jgi:pimeloyl-ACP methyl ester carboxylesterase
VIVLFHGLTNCPQQMVKLAEQLEQQGANVVVLRAPGHGQASGPGGLAGIEAEQFRDFADRSIDIATGLGDHVTVMGLSLGGLISTWTVIERPEVQRAVIIAPAYQLGGYSEPVQYAVGNLFARMPNVAIPSSGEGLGDHAYPETPTRGVGQMLRLGRYVMGQAAAHDDLERRGRAGHRRVARGRRGRDGRASAEEPRPAARPDRPRPGRAGSRARLPADRGARRRTYSAAGAERLTRHR